MKPVIDVHLPARWRDRALRADVRSGLTREPKELPPKWFYDARGSELFDQITRLDEYYPFRREREILSRRATDIARRRFDTLIELGSGTSEKTRILLDAMVEHGSLTTYVPFDVSQEFLADAADSLAAAYPGLAVHGVVGDFDHHLERLPRGGRRLVAFLGGTIGNLDPPARKSFFADLAGGLEHGDGLLLGTDLVKDPDRLVLAYDDPGGVTAEFNLNVLRVINGELDADFDLGRFTHVARWMPDEGWIEMRLRSTERQEVHIADLGLRIPFAAQEEMRTEISAKFTRPRIVGELASAGFALEEWWTDTKGDFALSLSTVT